MRPFLTRLLRPFASAPTFSGLDDPRFLEFIRSGDSSPQALGNMAVLRCVSLICGTVGTLPLNLIETGPARKIANDHPVHRLLKYRPNSWQTPLEFKRQMELAKLRTGNAYARIIWSAGRPLQLIPLDSSTVTAEMGNDFHMRYRIHRGARGEMVLPQREIFHLRDLSIDGVTGLSRIQLADQALRLADQSERAAIHMFTTGNLAGGALEVPADLNEKQAANIRKSLAEQFAGASSNKKWMLLEGGIKANPFTTARDSQHIENRTAQVEEIARLFGVPRPLLFMDDTSWGSGIEQLGIFFVQYTMLEHFTNWEQAIARALLSEDELQRYTPKFNVRALMRGTLKDQAEYFAKALGSGGAQSWHTANEIRDLAEYPKSVDPDADRLHAPRGTVPDPPPTFEPA